MYEALLNSITEKTALNENDQVLIKRYFEPVLYPKNRIIEAEGDIPKYLYFIVSGYLRLFHYDDKGDEYTTHINCPHGFFSAYTHFVNQTPSHENIECITACELLRITQADLEKLQTESEAMKTFSLRVFQESMLYNEKRANELAILSAEERYRKLIANYPDILHNVPVQYIASFLGMKPESLSRIRRKILNG